MITCSGKKWLAEFFLPLCFLGIVTIFSYLPLLHGGEYLFDDKAFLNQNPAYQKLSTLRQSLAFCAKPGRPVSNVLIGFAHWLDPNSTKGQRLISILNHTAVVLLLYLYLFLLRRKTSVLPPMGCFVIALLFSIHPASSEAVAIAFFRGRLTGTFFTLLSLIVAHGLMEKGAARKWKIFYGTLIFIFLGGATLSNEEFGLFAPLALFLCSFFYSENRDFSTLKRIKYFVFLILCQTIWGIVLWNLLKKDSLSITPYQVGAKSFDYYPYGFQLLMAGKAILDGLPKILSGHRLSIMPGWVRKTPEQTLDEFGTFLLFIEWGLLGYFIFRAKRGIQIWGAWFFVALSFYFFLPNINIGAERYLYFPFIGIFCGLAQFIWASLKKYFPQSAKTSAFFLVLTLFGFWEYQLQVRLRSYNNSLQLWGWEAEHEPELLFGWDNLRVTLLTQRWTPNELMEIKHLFDLPSEHPATYHVTEWVFFEHLKDKKRAGEALINIKQHFNEREIMGIASGIYQASNSTKIALSNERIIEIRNLSLKLSTSLAKTGQN